MQNSGFNLLMLFTFFYAIFWASTLEFNAKYRPFDPIGFFNKESEAKKIRRRFYLSILIIDFLPMSYFALIFYLIDHFTKIYQINWYSLMLIGITSLSVFGINRIYPAIVLNQKTAHLLYSKEEIAKVEIRRHKNFFIAYFVSGLIYLAIPFLTISLIHFLQ